MTMKKKIAILLVFTLALVMLPSCGSKDTSQAKQAEQAEKINPSSCEHSWEKQIVFKGKDCAGLMSCECYDVLCSKCGTECDYHANPYDTACGNVHHFTGYFEINGKLYKTGVASYSNECKGVNVEFIPVVVYLLNGEYLINDTESTLYEGEIYTHYENAYFKQTYANTYTIEKIENKKEISLSENMTAHYYKISNGQNTIMIPTNTVGNFVDEEGQTLFSLDHSSYRFSTYTYDGIEYDCFGEGGYGMSLESAEQLLRKLGADIKLSHKDVGAYDDAIVIESPELSF